MTDVPTRIQRKRTKGWRMPEGAINVTRPCDWSNPFRVGGTLLVEHKETVWRGDISLTRELAVELFRTWVDTAALHAQIRRELAGHNLVCWCALDQPCHADVLLEIANPDD